MRLGERRATTSEGHRAVVLELAREFDDTFNEHIESGEVSAHPPVLSTPAELSTTAVAPLRLGGGLPCCAAQEWAPCGCPHFLAEAPC